MIVAAKFSVQLSITAEGFSEVPIQSNFHFKQVFADVGFNLFALIFASGMAESYNQFACTNGNTP